MNLIKEISPCFDKVTSVTDSKEFVETFCMKALQLLEEFKSSYSKAIAKKQIKDLDAITHKIGSTMKWLDLDEFVSFTRSYKSIDLADNNAARELQEEVMHYSNMIEKSIQSKLKEL